MPPGYGAVYSADRCVTRTELHSRPPPTAARGGAPVMRLAGSQPEPPAKRPFPALCNLCRRRHKFHKIKNVRGKLPERLRAVAERRMRQAYHAESALKAEGLLSELAAELDKTPSRRCRCGRAWPPTSWIVVWWSTALRSSGQGGGEVFWPPVMTPGPQFPDQLGRWHG